MWRGGGYSETQLAENKFRVSFRGNGLTSRERAADLSLLRAAELALDSGLTHFVVIQTTEELSKSTPPPIAADGSIATYPTRPAITYPTVVKPRVTHTIVCFSEEPQTVSVVYHAESLRIALIGQYGLEVNE